MVIVPKFLPPAFFSSKISSYSSGVETWKEMNEWEN